MTEQRFAEIITNNVACVGGAEDSLRDFFSTQYTMIELKGNGVIGYSEHDDFYYLWFAYNDGLHSNTKLVYNTVKRLSKTKQVLYSGVSNVCINNCTEIYKGVYKLNLGD